MPLAPASVRPLLAAALLICSLGAAAQAVADDGWSEESRSDVWVLYTRDVAGSDAPAFRLVSRTEEPIERVIDALTRKSQEERYLADGYRRTVLERGDDYVLTHLHLDVPIATDRALVVVNRWSTDPDTGVHRATWEPVEGERFDLDQGAVRMHTRGSWEFTPLVNGGTRLVYEQHTELGGWFPAWLIERRMNPEIINELTILLGILDEELPAVSAAPAVDVERVQSPSAVPLPQSRTSLPESDLDSGASGR
jgi:hypothetical protein